MKANKRGRRQFLRGGAALAALAIGKTQSLSAQIAEPQDFLEGPRTYGERSRFETSLRNPTHTPVGDSVGIITPSALHFVNNHSYNPPDIDPQQHRLMIHGMVERPLVFTMEELKRLPSVSRVHFIECAGNSAEGRNHNTIQETHGFMSCSEWTGVLLSVLLREAGVQEGASWVLAEGADTPKHSKSILLEKAMEDVLVAYGQNGEAIRPDQGYPLRLVTPGWEGISNVKWLRRLKVVDEAHMARMESTMYIVHWPRLNGRVRWYNFEMGPKSVITRPSGGQQMAGRGYTEITGLAWSGRGAIRRVEVSTNGGRSWSDAQIQQPVHRIAHTRFVFPWTWNGEEALIQSRCTDDAGMAQPTLDDIGRMWGVDRGFWRTTRTRVNHFNPIWPWKINPDGSVHNGLLV